jgi:Uri superfamily endonuclease
VGRHFKQEKKCRWHIDYLSTRMAVTRVWYTTRSVKLECQWAQHFFDLGGTLPVKGFGASDCRCNSHLLFFPGRPCLSDFQKLAGVCFPDADKNRIKALNKTHFRAG